MPRPQKWRKVCAMPRCTRFDPENVINNVRVEMTIDEYETIRLIDWEGLTQEQCAEQLEVGRTTVQSIYQSARKKLANCIVNGSPLAIGGGEYRLCAHGGGGCGIGCQLKWGSYCPKEMKNGDETNE